MANISREGRRRLRQKRVRGRVRGTTDRPRLNVFRSLSNIYAQVIDDATGNTLAQASTVDKDLQAQVDGKKKAEQAQIVGKIVAERALAKGVKLVVFDRAGYYYHGRIKALAEAARSAGLSF
jgi:large subunit ribosomal protein L18